jgi:serine/threonine protein kinase
MGRVISRKYEELGQLGQGGQGVVYKVRHVEHKTILALKALPAFLLEDPDMVSRFEQESALMTRLQHRNIARVLGTGRDDALNLSYFVMEYIQGRTLKQYVYEKGLLPLPEVLEIARQVASALDYAHNQTPPVIHRDIKPTNIMIEDHTGRAVVLDFGIAKELDDGEGMRTKTGVMMGTWKYCSPEQLRHEPLSGSADV